MNPFLKRMLSTSAAILMISQGVIASDAEFNQFAEAVKGKLLQDQQTILNLSKEVELRGAVLAQIEADNKAVLQTAAAKIPAAALRDFDGEIAAKRAELTQYEADYAALQRLTSQKSAADASVGEFLRELQTAQQAVTDFVAVTHTNIEWVDADKAFKIADGVDDGGLAVAQKAYEDAEAKVSAEKNATFAALNKVLEKNADDSASVLKNVKGLTKGEKELTNKYFSDLGHDTSKVEWKTVVAQVKIDAQAYADDTQAVKTTRKSYEDALSASSEYSALQTKVGELNTEYARLAKLSTDAETAYNTQVNAVTNLDTDIKAITNKGVALDNQDRKATLDQEILQIQSDKEAADPQPLENEDLNNAWERHSKIFNQFEAADADLAAADEELQEYISARGNSLLLDALLSYKMNGTPLNVENVEKFVVELQAMLGEAAGLISFNKAELKNFGAPLHDQGGSSSSADPEANAGEEEEKQRQLREIARKQAEELARLEAERAERQAQLEAQRRQEAEAAARLAAEKARDALIKNSVDF